MAYKEKIEFYKHRNIGERLAVTADFLKQNWKILFKSVIVVAIPLSLITGYSMIYYLKWYVAYLSHLGNGSHPEMPLQVILFLLVSIVSFLIVFSLLGTIMIKYEKGELNSETGWNDLSRTFFSLIRKILLIYFYLFLFLFALALLIGLVFAISGTVAGVVFILLAFLASIAIIPPLMLVFFPACFNNASAWNSIKIAFSLGFKDWGNIFVALLIAMLMLGVISTVFSMPYQILTLFTKGEINSLGFLLVSFSSLGNFLAYPFLFVYMAFQYFSIVEKEEGVSMQSQIDEFDNL